MTLRPTQSFTSDLVRRGLQSNFARLARLQEEVSSGKRILRPSDDAVGTSIVLSLRRQAGNVQSFQHAIASARPFLQSAASALEHGSGILAEARALVLQGISGTLDQENRDTVAYQIELLRTNLLEVANSRTGDRWLFAGTDTGAEPFEDVQAGEMIRARYAGNDQEQSVLVQREVELAINVPGSEIFARFEYSHTSYAGVTGARHGTTADSGSGYHELTVRHDATSGLGAGLVSANGGADDTIVGDHVLLVDATAGTVQLGSGAVLDIPGPGDSDYADFVVTDADGSELHLDFSAWTGADFSGPVHGDASIALDDGTFAALDLSATDLELVDDASQSVIHVDATAITRAGTDVVTFRGSANVFDTLQGIIEDLRAGDELSDDEMTARMNERLQELDRNSTNLRSALSEVGARLDRIDTSRERLEEADVHLKGLISQTEEVDLSTAVLDLNRAELTLQAAQATGARLLQQTLLNYIR